MKLTRDVRGAACNLLTWKNFVALECSAAVADQEFVLHSLLNLLNDGVLVQEEHLVLGRMNIDIKVLRSDVEREVDKWRGALWKVT